MGDTIWRELFHGESDAETASGQEFTRESQSSRFGLTRTSTTTTTTTGKSHKMNRK